MKFPFLTFALTLLLGCATLSEEKPSFRKLNPPERADQNPVVMISFDGFRHDYIEKFSLKEFAALAKEGVRAQALIPSYPTKTFPNHYTLATGLRPAHHGIIENSFYDPDLKKNYSLSDPFTVRDGSWYGGTPLWVAAEKAGLVTASYFWVGSEAPIQGVLPTYYYEYKHGTPNQDRVDQVLKWLELPKEGQPKLIMLYFSLVDSTGHEKGPESPEVKAACLEADQLLGRLRKEAKNANLIVVSDHGMTSIDSEKVVPIHRFFDSGKFEITGSAGIMNLHAKAPRDLQPTYKRLKNFHPHVKVFLRNQIPERYQLAGSRRVGDIVLIADHPWSLVSSDRDLKKLENIKGAHGWGQEVPDMHGIFLARGPALKSGLAIPALENVDIYPLVLRLLNVELKGKVDGKSNWVNSVLRP